MKEIFVNHSLNGNHIDEKIRFIGACNPFRKNNENDEGLKLTNNDEEEMTYIVNPLPNSLLNYIFYFKSLDENAFEKYIEAIIGIEFPEGEGKDSENSILRNNAIKAIFDSHNYVRKHNGISSVSLWDLQRFKRAYKFFNKYYEYKKEFYLNNDDKNDKSEKLDKWNIKSKVQSFVLSIFIAYYIKIFKSGQNTQYLTEINTYVKNLANNLKIEEWINDQYFKEDIVEKEEEFLFNEMDIKSLKGIGQNTSLKENIFLMFFSIFSHIPLIVIGKQGCSKSLSIQLIIRIMRGEFSESNF